ncbi:MAG: hypothetical protein MZV70_57070 [Desulfobacterales bacterium]|nr:hypothetical protein [Desulfobacterales bacterium]
MRHSLRWPGHLNEAEDLPTIFDTVVNHLPKVLDAKYCSLFTRNPSSGDLEIKAHNHIDIGQDPFISVGTQRDSIMNLCTGPQQFAHHQGHRGGDRAARTRTKYTTKSFMCILIRQKEKMLLAS